MPDLSPAFAATGIYAALNMAILIWIGLATGRLRGRHKVAIGDGGVPHLTRIMRGHANAAENIPMFFVMFILAVLAGMPMVAIHAFGVGFTLGRVLHAWHFIQEDAPRWQRGTGFLLSFLAQVLMVVGLIGHGIGLGG